MNRIVSSAFFVLLLTVLHVAGCGGSKSIGDELEKVPGLCFLHIHFGEGLDISLLPEQIDAIFPVWLCDSLLTHGEFGASLLGINLTDFTPQLLFLSRFVSTEEMLRLAEEGFQCNSEENQGQYDLFDDRGSMVGSIASKNGWACLITGSGADRAAGRWLALERNESLASDSALFSISESDADLTILVSHNTIGFLSVIPTGMLNRSQINYLNMTRNIISNLGISALRMSLDIDSNDPGALLLDFQIVRQDGYVTSLSAGFSDTGIRPDSLIGYLAEFYGLE